MLAYAGLCWLMLGWSGGMAVDALLKQEPGRILPSFATCLTRLLPLQAGAGRFNLYAPAPKVCVSVHWLACLRLDARLVMSSASSCREDLNWNPFSRVEGWRGQRFKDWVIVSSFCHNIKQFVTVYETLIH